MTERRPTLAELAAQSQGTAGIVCPRCGFGSLPVLYTRRVERENVRVRKCRRCGHKVLCKERIVGDVQTRDDGELEESQSPSVLPMNATRLPPVTISQDGHGNAKTALTSSG